MGSAAWVAVIGPVLTFVGWVVLVVVNGQTFRPAEWQHLYGVALLAALAATFMVWIHRVVPPKQRKLPVLNAMGLTAIGIQLLHLPFFPFDHPLVLALGLATHRPWIALIPLAVFSVGMVYTLRLRRFPVDDAEIPRSAKRALHGGVVGSSVMLVLLLGMVAWIGWRALG